ncbi:MULTISPECIES: LysR family transcriptional regulator [Geobacillus]|uniref:LysR family transcriptional regulator n=1 Tax=Geobacillus thermocatenulatus TaxID=33938 RepID=A0AA91QLC9_9BACL|nr:MULTISPECIES: LysR family transcriptional regulator [Geobacillus]KLR72266.1 transcriptional regulator [Geobacillus sp. T6]OXB86661.1 LysR family transcriptional regulator [Geobacillus thermocatenulatus]RAN29978.1 transcriptional regulator [Geobacillus sp. A8]
MDQLLYVFVKVVEKGNFTKAAEELHMTQPAVSQHIQTLERLFDTKLLDRTNKYVKLNKAGEIVYHYAKEILGLYTRMNQLVDDLLNRAGGELSIGASYTYGEYVLPQMIAKLHQHYPLIKPTITIGNSNEIVEMVSSHQLDVGIIEMDIETKNVYIEPFAKDQMVVVASVHHPYAQKESVQMDDLRNATWIVRETGSGTRKATDEFFLKHNFFPSSIMEFGSTQLIKEAVEAGLGLTFLSLWTIKKELSFGTLTIIPIDDEPFFRHFSLVTSKTPFYTKAMEVFLTIVRTHQPSIIHSPHPPSP